LAWARTALAVLVNGVLLLLKEGSADAAPVWFLPACLAGAGSAAIYAISRQRQRALTRQPGRTPQEARRMVRFAAGLSFALLTLTTIAALLSVSHDVVRP
jgi:hypothetical protein